MLPIFISNSTLDYRNTFRRKSHAELLHWAFRWYPLRFFRSKLKKSCRGCFRVTLVQWGKYSNCRIVQRKSLPRHPQDKRHDSLWYGSGLWLSSAKLHIHFSDFRKLHGKLWKGQFLILYRHFHSISLQPILTQTHHVGNIHGHSFPTIRLRHRVSTVRETA